MSSERTDPFVRALTGPRDREVVTLERHYGASREELWDALTDPARLARWIGTLDPAPAGPGDPYAIRLSDEPSDLAHGTVVSCQRPARLVCRWEFGDEPASRVTVSLLAEGPTTRLQLRHAQLRSVDVADYGGGWEGLLTQLARLLGEPASAAAPAWPLLAGDGLELVRTLPADPVTVWAAFTDPAVLRTWWWSHWSGVEFSVDARVDGHYRIHAPAQQITVDGEFLEVEAPGHLSFTWRWTDADGTSSDEACDLTLTPVEGGTELTLRHTGPWPDGTAAEAYRQGWDFTLGSLERVLLAGRPV